MPVAARAPAAPSLDDLRRIPSFSELDDAALAALCRAMVTRAFAPGQIIFFEGDATPGIWFVRGGRVRIFKLARDGREQVLCVAQAHTCAGCPLFFGGRNPASAEALDHGTLYFLPMAAVEALLPAYPQIGVALLRILAERQRVLVGVATTLVLRCVATRLAQVLLAESGGVAGAAVHMTHAELAQRVGVAREVVSRTLSRWSREGLLTCRRGSIVLHDPQALRQHLGGRSG